MDLPELEIEEGELSSDASSLQENFTSGIPEKYLQAHFQEKQFHNLPCDDTFSSGLNQTDKERKAALKLDLKGYENAEERSGIMFSPGGTEAYMFTGTESAQENLKVSSTKNSEITPREINDPIFLENNSSNLSLKRLSNKPSEERKALFMDSEERQKTKEAGHVDSSNISTAESSPRFHDFSRKLPHPPKSGFRRGQKLNEPNESLRLNISDLEASGTNVTDPESLPSPLKARPVSPSVASVASATSSTASGMLSGRKHLEWDSGADLGYYGEAPPTNPGASLDTLEKLAIGNYSAFLVEKSATNKDYKNIDYRKQSSSDSKSQLLEQKMNREEEMRQIRLQKFTKSLMKQKELQALRKQASASPNRRKRSQSRESARKSNSSPVNASVLANQPQEQRGPMKSASLIDLKSLEREQEKMRAFRSNSDFSQHFFSRGLKHHLALSEPSSCSSSVTVVPFLSNRENHKEANKVLLPISTDPQSLPSNLVGFFPASEPREGKERASKEMNVKPRISSQYKSSQASLNNRKFGSRSFETVINMGQRHLMTNKWATADNLHTSDSIEDTEEDEACNSKTEKQMPHKQKFTNSRRQAWVEGKINNEESALKEQISRNSSINTTSDEEKAPKNIYKTATSTMESNQIDRAKSFEYFPGDNFQLQENSSSYEYLPGHLITERPGTVVSNYQNISGISSLLHTADDSTSTSSERIFDANVGMNEQVAAKMGKDCRDSRVSRKIQLEFDAATNLDGNLRNIADELNKRSKELLAAHLRKTKHFYKKIKKHIAYISSPSISMEDTQKKQKLLEKLIAALGNHENLESILASENQNSEESQGGLMSKRDAETVVSLSFHETEQTASKSVATNTQDETIRITSKLEKDANFRRIEQLRLVRKELKKLERLEYQKIDEQKGTSIFFSDTDSSSLISSSTCFSEKNEHKIDVKDQKRFLKKQTDQTKKNAAHLSNKVDSQSLTVTVVEDGPKEKGLRSGRISQVEVPSSSNKTECWSQTIKLDFGQTYPTPREPEKKTLASSTKNKEVQTNNYPETLSISTRQRQNKIQRPVAYYLNIATNDGPIFIGKRSLKRTPDSELSKENRSIFANYIAGLSTETISKRDDKQSSREENIEPRQSNKILRNFTLQDALAARHPNFLKVAEERRQLLLEIRREREEQTERRRQFLEEIAALGPEVRSKLQVKVPEIRVRRVFNYREMIMQTRKKFQELPEFRYKEQQQKKRSHSRTNRIIRDLYKSKLQANVLKGRVSHAHYQSVIDF